MMAERTELLLRWWAITALVLLAALYGLPPSALGYLTPESGGNLLVKAVVVVALLAVILGFYLRMFYECGFSRTIYAQSAWILFFVFVPIFSAFIYFFVTRSDRYQQYVRRKRSGA
jgi:hypothetical protein